MFNSSNFLFTANGPVPIRMTNDYLFRALLQRNNKVLRGLLCSLLHLSETAIQSVTITNPILLGEAINEKDFFLDVNILMNNNTIINLEMQVINESNWPERSLSYLCRDFNTLNKGEDYLNVKSTIQIGLLNFTLFPEHPEFYATYKFLNAKNHSIYSDKLRLSVLDLTKIDLATEEDKSYGIDHWASLFKATTWEEIKMLAQNDEKIKEASTTIYQLSQEEKIRLQCEAREEYYRIQRTNQRRYEASCAKIEEQASVIAAKDAAIAQKDAIIAELTAQLEAFKKE